MKEQIINFLTAPATYIALAITIAWVYILLKIIGKLSANPQFVARIIFSMLIVITAVIAYLLSFGFFTDLLNR